MTRFKLFAAMLAVLGLALPCAVTAEEAPGVFKIPGTDSTIKFNGFAEMVYVYEFAGQIDLGSTGEIYNNPAFIALDHTPLTNLSPNSLGFEVAYSRFGVQTTTPSSVGTIGTRIEGDFNTGVQLQGTAYTHHSTFRVRHAYGTVGDVLLLGQTWTTFADLAAYPDQQDENPLPSLAALRAPQVRVTFPAGPTKISLAAENPYAVNGSVPGRYYTIPDFIGRLDVPAGFGSLSVRALTRQFKNTAHSAQGFGGAVGAALKVGGDTLVLDGSVGAGMGPYQTGAFQADAIDIGTDIKLLTTFGVSAGYTHVWTPQLRSNLMFGGVWTSSNDTLKAAIPATYATLNKALYTAGLNTYWSVAKNFWVGAEFYYNVRQTFEDAAGVSAYGHEGRGEITTHFDFF